MVRSILWCLWVGHTSLKKVFRSSWFVCWTFKSPDLAQKGFLETFSDCGLKGNYWNCFHFSQIRQACFLVKNDHFSLIIYRLPGLQKHACESKSVSRILRTCFKPIHVFLCEFPALHHTICCGPIKSCDFFFFFQKGGKAGRSRYSTFSHIFCLYSKLEEHCSGGVDCMELSCCKHSIWTGPNSGSEQSFSSRSMPGSSHRCLSTWAAALQRLQCSCQLLEALQVLVVLTVQKNLLGVGEQTRNSANDKSKVGSSI